MDELKKGLNSGKFKQGKFNVNRDYWIEGTVRVQGVAQFVLIPGLEMMNRAIDGDTVVIEILPENEWKAPSHRYRFVLEPILFVFVISDLSDP
jgi:exosome complex exonuclease DIS3/RRP44